jgi:hypothetical protein
MSDKMPFKVGKISKLLHFFQSFLHTVLSKNELSYRNRIPEQFWRLGFGDGNEPHGSVVTSGLTCGNGDAVLNGSKGFGNRRCGHDKKLAG